MKIPHSLLVRIIKKTMVPWYAVTTVLYFAAIPLTIWIFPATTLLLTVFVLFGGFTASMASLASALISADQDRITAQQKTSVDGPAQDSKHEPEVEG